MDDNEGKKEKTADAERKSHGCLIAFLVFFIIFVAPIIVVIALLFYGCHRKPDLSEYHLSGDTFVLSGEEFDYRITYESYDEKSIKLSITIDEEFKTPNFLYFYTGTKNIKYVYYNDEKYDENLLSSVIPIGAIELPVETNTCEVELFYEADKFKGYVKCELTHLPTNYESREAFYIKLY